MYQKLTLYSFFLIFLIPCYSANSAEINWLKLDRPPWFIVNGDDQSKGYGDLMARDFQQDLSDYTHRSKRVNLARLNYKMKQGDKFCISALAYIPAFKDYMV